MTELDEEEEMCDAALSEPLDLFAAVAEVVGPLGVEANLSNTVLRLECHGGEDLVPLYCTRTAIRCLEWDASSTMCTRCLDARNYREDNRRTRHWNPDTW